MSLAFDTVASSPTTDLPVISAADLVRYGECVVVDGLVIDVHELLRWHPGGEAVLRAHLGGDASPDFHHVAAHARPGVRKALQRMAVARVVDERTPEPGTWDAVLMHVRLLRNSFETQRALRRDPLPTMVYLGQSYYHVVQDHLGRLRQELRELLGTADAAQGAEMPEAQPGEMLKAVIADVAHAGDDTRAAEVIDAIRAATASLFDVLTEIVAAGSETMRADAARQALAHIGAWLHDEQRDWAQRAASVEAPACQ